MSEERENIKRERERRLVGLWSRRGNETTEESSRGQLGKARPDPTFGGRTCLSHESGTASNPPKATASSAEWPESARFVQVHVAHT